MSTVLCKPEPRANAEVAPWALALAGFGAMYLPSYWVAANGLWQKDDFAHAPIVLAVVLWLFWQVHDQIRQASDRPIPAAGWPLLVLGLSLYSLGRVFAIASVEFLSQPLVLAAIVLLLQGPAALRAAWFALAYALFMVPLPATLVDAVTGPLKQWISLIVVDVLYAAGYPIARTGVMITIGQYHLLVADACSGLNSMFSLSALGTLFMYMMGRKSRLHNTLMLAAILPIAFVANVVRVVALALITFYFGDEAGQGLLHGAGGLTLFLVALALFILLDKCLAASLRSRSHPGG